MIVVKLDSRYSYITSIGSLTYSSTRSFFYGIEIHGRGLAEVFLTSRTGLVRYARAQFKPGFKVLGFNTENVGLISMKYLGNVSERIKLMF